MGNLSGIDIASYQGGLNTEKIAGDFVIVKATQGTGYINPYWKAQADGAIRGGKILGLYHYANGSGVQGEVNFFLQTIKDYIGKAILCLDWEHIPVGGPNSQFSNPGYAKEFMDQVKGRTGVTMFIYGSKDSCFNAFNWTKVEQAGYQLWGAQYASYAAVNGYNQKPWQSARPWGAFGQDISIFQYTSNLRLPGWNGGLDGDICYLSREELAAYATGRVAGDVVVPPKDDDPIDKASLLQLVAGVQSGEYGTGETRKKKLGKRYDEVQKMINYIYDTDANTLANDVLTGKFGSGELRKKVLGDRYEDIQKRVNAKLAGHKSVEQLAQEVIEGKWGNGEERVRRLRAAGYDSAAVQKEVNNILEGHS